MYDRQQQSGRRNTIPSNRKTIHSPIGSESRSREGGHRTASDEPSASLPSAQCTQGRADECAQKQTTFTFTAQSIRSNRSLQAFSFPLWKRFARINIYTHTYIHTIEETDGSENCAATPTSHHISHTVLQWLTDQQQHANGSGGLLPRSPITAPSAVGQVKCLLSRQSCLNQKPTCDHTDSRRSFLIMYRAR